MRNRDAAIVLAMLTPCGACGSRTPLDLGTPFPAAVADAGALSDASSGLPCEGSSSPGAVLWQASLPAGAAFTGPLASDSSGTTYFMGPLLPASRGAYTVVALDSCGRQLWQTAPTPTSVGASPMATPTLLVDGDQIVVQWGSVDAFDRATGAHRWSADLSAVAGEDLRQDNAAEVGPSAADVAGTTFVPLSTMSKTVLLAVDPTGSASTLATIPMSATGNLISTIVDGDGQVDLEVSGDNGAFVDSFSTTGALAFSSGLLCSSGIVGPLASGTAFLAAQGGPCLLTLHGDMAFSPQAAGGDRQSMAIDRENNVYVTDPAVVYSFGASGASRWTFTPQSPVIAGPLLANGDVLFVAHAEMGQCPAPASLANLVALDTATGRVVGTYAVGALVPCAGMTLLLTPAEQLVLAADSHVTAVAAGRAPSGDAPWPTPQGGTDGRRATLGW